MSEQVPAAATDSLARELTADWRSSWRTGIAGWSQAIVLLLLISVAFVFFLQRLEFSRSFLPQEAATFADDCILCADAHRYAPQLLKGNYFVLKLNRHPLGVILTGAGAEPLARLGMPRLLAVSVTLAFWQALAAGALFVFLRRQGVGLAAATAAPAAIMMAFGTVTTLSVIDNYGTALFGAAAFLLAAGELARHAGRHPRAAGLLAGVLAGVLAGWGHLPNIAFGFFYSALAWSRLPHGLQGRVIWSVLAPTIVAAVCALAPVLALSTIANGGALAEPARMLDLYASVGHFLDPRTVHGYTMSFIVFAWTAPTDAIQCRFPPEAVASILGSLPRLGDAVLGIGLTVAGLTAGFAAPERDRSDAWALAAALAALLGASFLFYLYFNPQEVLLYSSQWTTAAIVGAVLVLKNRAWLPAALVLSVVLGLAVNAPPLYNPASFDGKVCCPLPSY